MNHGLLIYHNVYVITNLAFSHKEDLLLKLATE